MRIWAVLAAVLSLFATSASAEDASQGVIAYPASYFATMGVNTAYDMVLHIPGFTFDNGSAVRGFAGAAGNVLVDGLRPASKTDDLQTLLQRIPAAQVERIDLIRGGAPGIDMQGKTVVANIIRRKAAGFAGVATLWRYEPEDLAFDPGAQLEGTWRTGDRTFEAAVHAEQGHDGSQGGGPHQVFAPNGQLVDSSPTYAIAPNWLYRGNTAYEGPLLGGRLRMTLMLEDQPYHKYVRDDFAIAGREVERDRIDQTDAELGLHYNRDLTRKVSLEVLGLQHLGDYSSTLLFQTPADDQVFHLGDALGETIARGILHWGPIGVLDVDAGGEFAFNWLTTRTRFADNGAPIAVPAGDVHVEEKRGEAFTTATWRATKTLTVEAGIRVEDSTISSTGDVALTKTLVYPKPRVLLTFTPDAADQVRVRVERDVGQLDFNAFIATAALNGVGVVAGNPNLLPQQDWVFEAAWDRHVWKDGVVSLTARRLVLTDVVDRAPVFSPSGVFDEPANIGCGSENDLVASFNLPLKRLGIAGGTFWGSGTWRSSQVTDPTTGQKRPISGQHALDAQLNFSNAVPRLKLTWGAIAYIGTLERYFRFDEIDSTRAPTYYAAYVDWRPRPDLSIHTGLYPEVQLTNVTRQVYAGPRSTSPLDFTDFREHRFGVLSDVHIRKTFN
jgi:hypothetical protein